jgi:serine/threonine protein kinase
MALGQGTVLHHNRYRVARLLGQGGFGAVYRAWDIHLNRACALKENLDTSAEAQRQFEREAQILGSLTHPNLPRVTDHFFVPGQGQYLVMDFIDGEDLETLVARQGPVEASQAITWISQVADALIYLHSQRQPVVHRDVKPANIRITPDGRAMLVDFGLAKVYDAHLRTTIGARAVTPGYSPPEQYGQGNTDARTDIYALAATLYTLLTGQEPTESIQRVVGSDLRPAHHLNTQVALQLSQAVEQAMSLNPSQRYQTVIVFKELLHQLVTKSQIIVTPQTYPRPGALPTLPAAISTTAHPAQNNQATGDWAANQMKAAPVPQTPRRLSRSKPIVAAIPPIKTNTTTQQVQINQTTDDWIADQMKADRSPKPVETGPILFVVALIVGCLFLYWILYLSSS